MGDGGVKTIQLSITTIKMVSTVRYLTNGIRINAWNLLRENNMNRMFICQTIESFPGIFNPLS